MKKEKPGGLYGASTFCQDAADRPLAGRREDAPSFFRRPPIGIFATGSWSQSHLWSFKLLGGVSGQRFFLFSGGLLEPTAPLIVQAPWWSERSKVFSSSGGVPFCRHPLSGGVAGTAAGVVEGGHTAHPTTDYVSSSWWAPVSSGWQGKPG